MNHKDIALAVFLLGGVVICIIVGTLIEWHLGVHK